VLLTAQIKRLERQLLPTLIPDADVQRLLWVPGVGKVAAFTLYLEIDGIQRFPHVRAFFADCRLVPGAKTSGGTSRHRRTKDGNRSLTRAFRHAAVRAIPYDPEIQAWDRPRLRTKGAMIARALVATALARIVYHVLAKQADFNGRFKGTTLSRTKTRPWPAGGPSRTPSPAAARASARPARGATTVAPDGDGIRPAVDHRWDAPWGRARPGGLDAAAHVRR